MPGIHMKIKYHNVLIVIYDLLWTTIFWPLDVSQVKSLNYVYGELYIRAYALFQL